MKQGDLFHDEETSRNLLAGLLEDSLLYHQSADFKALLDFTTRLRNVAPFNAMLLHIQKPGVLYVATKYDWRRSFGRTIRDGARPLLILIPFGPVAFVYDIDDTDGPPLPQNVLNPFPAKGNMTEHDISRFVDILAKKKINVRLLSYGSGIAGNIQAIETYAGPEAGYHGIADKASNSYILHANSMPSASATSSTFHAGPLSPASQSSSARAWTKRLAWVFPRFVNVSSSSRSSWVSVTRYLGDMTASLIELPSVYHH